MVGECDGTVMALVIADSLNSLSSLFKPFKPVHVTHVCACSASELLGELSKPLLGLLGSSARGQAAIAELDESRHEEVNARIRIRRIRPYG